MNKKLLLSTTIAGTMFIAGMANPSLAATEVRTTRNWVEANTLSLAVELDMGDRDLSREELVRILNDRFYENCLESVETTSDGNVPTGAKIKLTDGKELTLVLFGDVDGDGKIGAGDAQAILLDRAGTKTIETGAARKAGDVVNPDGLRAADAQRILKYIADPSSLGSRYVDPERIPNDDILEVLGFSAAFASSGNNISTASTTGDVKVNENDIDVYIERNKLTQGYVDAEIGKWLDIKLDLPDGSWSIAGDVKSKKDTADHNKPIITVNTVNDKTTFTLTFNGEDIAINVNIHDISTPAYVKLSEVKENGSNNAAITDWQSTVKTTYALKGNANKMELTTKTLKYYNTTADAIETKEVSGFWYKVKAEVSGVNAENVVAFNVTTNEIYDVEKVSDTELYVWLNAEEASTKIKFINKNSTTKQLKSVDFDTEDTTVTFTNEGKLKVELVAAADPSDTTTKGPQKTNQDAVTVKTVTDNKITVEGELNKMKTYTLSSDGKYVPTKSNGKYVESGKKYYALIVDLGSLKNDYIHSDADQDTLLKLGKANDKKLSPFADGVTNGKDKAGTTSKPIGKDESILVWLDADEPTTTIAVRGTTDESKEYESEYFRFTVEFKDTSAPDILPFKATPRTDADSGDPTFDNNSVRVGLNENLAVNAKAVTVTEVTDKGKLKSNKETDITVNARQSAMKTIAGPDGTTSTWFALIVDTNVNRSELEFTTFNGAPLTGKEKPCDDYVLGVEGLAADEIVIWYDVNAGAGAAKTFIIRNVNDNNKTWTISLKATDASYVKVSNLVLPTIVKTDDKIAASQAYGSMDIAKAIRNNITKADSMSELINEDHVFDGELGLATNTTTGTKKVLKSNRNLLTSFTHPTLGAGKWILIEANVPDNIDVTGATINDSQNRMATVNEYDALGITRVGKVLIWVNADELKENYNNKVVLTTAGVEETHTFYFNFRNVATFKRENENASNFKAALADDDKRAKIKTDVQTELTPDVKGKNVDRLLFNSELLDVTSTKEGNVITVDVKGNFSGMFDNLGATGSKGRMFAYKLNLGVDINTTFYEKAATIMGTTAPTMDEINDALANASPAANLEQDAIDLSTAFGCGTTELCKNITFAKAAYQNWNVHDGSLFRTDIFEYTYNDEGDSLIFVVRYTQDDSVANRNDLLDKYDLAAS